MTYSRIKWICAVGALLTAVQSAPTLADSEANGVHYRVICHFDNEPICKAALETAEAAWPVTVDLWAIGDKKPAEPLEIHLYRNVADYEAAESDRTGGRFRSNLSFSDHKDKSSHIALQPPCTDQTLKKIGLPYLTRLLIAHEASHLCVYTSIPNYASHPDWLAEGTAMWVADRTMLQKKWSRSVRGNPDSSTNLERAQRLKKEGTLPSIGLLVSGKSPKGSTQDVYAVYYQLFRFLHTESNRKELKAVLAKARQLGGGGDYTERLRDSVLEILGGDEAVKKLDEAFATFVESEKPAWTEVYRSLDARSGQWVQVAFPNKNAIAWRMKPVGKKTYAVSGEVEILPNDKRQMNVLLGRDDSGLVIVALTAGFGINVFRFHVEGDRWEDLGKKQVGLVQVNRPIKFKIKVDGKKLRVELDGKLQLTCDVGDKDMTGPWGVGAQAGSAGIWRDVKWGG